MMLITGCLFYYSALIFIQILIWNINKPKNEIKCLFIYLILFPLFSFFLLMQIGHHLSITESIFYFFFTYSFNGFYFIIFYGIQDNSPSLLLINLIYKKKINDIKVIYKIFNNYPLIETRVTQLIKDEIVIKKDTKLQLTNRGYKIQKISQFFKKILKIEETI